MATRKPVKKASTQVELAPLVLVRGSEALLVDRALRQLRALALQADPAVERSELSAASYRAGELDILTSPSLFGESRFILIRDLGALTQALAEDLLSYIQAPVPEVWLVLVHPGGNAAGKKVVDAIGKAGFPIIAADPLKKDRDKLELVKSDVRAAGRSMDLEAMHAIVDALGSDLQAMAAAVSQLLSDVEGTISVDDVHRYHSGRVEASGFDIADALTAGDTAQALTLVRHAALTGVDPQMLIGACAMKFRSMAKVSVSGLSSSGLSMAPWQVERARRDLRGWTDSSLAGAIEAIALADEETKGLTRDRWHAIEKAVITICRLRARR